MSTATTTLDRRDHLIARQVLADVVADLAKQGLYGKALRQRSRETAEALRHGLIALSEGAADGKGSCLPDVPRPRPPTPCRCPCRC